MRTLLLILLACLPCFAQQDSQINSIQPDHVLAGTSSSVVTIKGVFNGGCSGGNEIYFNGTVLSATLIGTGILQVTVPGNLLDGIGSFPIQYQCFSHVSNLVRFRVLTPLASITSYAPTVFTSGDTPIVVHGSDFASNATILFDWQQITPGATCAFNLTFTPSTSSTEGPATLTINWGSIGGTVGSSTQVLTGTGTTAGTKIALSWTASPSASLTGYNVYRGTQSGGPYSLLASPGNVTSYNDTTPVHGNTYCYVVTAVGSNPPYAAASGNSNQACATF